MDVEEDLAGREGADLGIVDCGLVVLALCSVAGFPVEELAGAAPPFALG